MLWTPQSYECSEQLRVFKWGLWVLWTTQVIDDMSDFKSWAQTSRCYELVKAMHDINESGSCELRAIKAMKKLGLWMIWMILHCEIKPIDVVNNLGLWRTWMITSGELRALVDMNSLVLWLTKRTTSHEPRVLDTMNSLGLWMTWMSSGHWFVPSRVF